MCGLNRTIRSTYIVASAASVTNRTCSRNAALDLSMGGTFDLGARERVLPAARRPRDSSRIARRYQTPTTELAKRLDGRRRPNEGSDSPGEQRRFEARGVKNSSRGDGALPEWSSRGPFGVWDPIRTLPPGGGH